MYDENNNHLQLHYAENPKVAENLLSGTTDINYRTQEKCYINGYCIPAGFTPLATAIYTSKLEMADFFISQGARLENIDNSGNSALHFAARSDDSFAILQRLIEEKRISINTVNSKQQSALHFIFTLNIIPFKDHTQGIRYLLDEKSFDIAAQDGKGNSVLHIALKDFYFSNSNKLKILLEHNDIHQIINLTNNDGKTPLHLAPNFRPDLITTLVARGANFNIVDKNRKNPLHVFLATHTKELNDSNLLSWLEKIDDVNHVDNTGQSLLHLCATRGHTQSAQYLIRRGANPALRDNQGKNAAYFALYGNQLDTYFLLKQHNDLSIEMFSDEITKQKYSLLHPRYDSEKKWVIEVCLQAILFTRWKYPKNYTGYADTIAHLIKQYGKQNFIGAVGKLFDTHLRSLDLKNVREAGPHTDINDPYPKGIMVIVRYLIKDKYKIFGDMKKYGALVNVKTIFGDKDLWEILKNRHRAIYDALIEIVYNWPSEIDSKAVYNISKFNPFLMFKNNFSEAFQYIEGDLPQDIGSIYRLSSAHEESQLGGHSFKCSR